MLIQTKDLGAVEIPEDTVVQFPKGVYGFEECRRFVLLDTGSPSGVMHLQCVDSPTPRFIVLDPFALVEDYAPRVPQEALRALGAESVEQLSIFSITVEPQNFRAATANLKSPVAINFEKRLGMQVILDYREYTVRFPLFAQERTE